MKAVDTVVVVTRRLGADGRGQVGHLIGHLIGDGVTVELLVVGGDDSAWSAIAPAVSLDVLLKRRTENALRLLRPERPDWERPTSRSVRYLANRSRSRWIVCDPMALPLLETLPTRPPVVVAHLADPSATPRPTTASSHTPDRWLAISPSQARHLPASSSVVIAGSLAPVPQAVVAEVADGAGGPLVLSTAPHRWEEIDHLVEFVHLLRTRRPDVPLAVLTDAGDDEWLVRHDLDHLGASAHGIAVLRREDDTVIRPGVIIRTGYAASDPDLVRAAAVAGIPTLGFELGDLPGLAPMTAPSFAVEQIVDRALELLDPIAREGSAAMLTEASRGHGDPARQLARVLAPITSKYAPWANSPVSTSNATPLAA